MLDVNLRNRDYFSEKSSSASADAGGSGEKVLNPWVHCKGNLAVPQRWGGGVVVNIQFRHRSLLDEKNCIRLIISQPEECARGSWYTRKKRE